MSHSFSRHTVHVLASRSAEPAPEEASARRGAACPACALSAAILRRRESASCSRLVAHGACKEPQP